MTKCVRHGGKQINGACGNTLASRVWVSPHFELEPMKRINTEPENQSIPHLVEFGIGTLSLASSTALRLIECLVADHPAGVVLAEELGVAPEHFIDDLQIIFEVIQLGRGWNTDQLCRMVRVALKRYHFWDNREIAANYGAGRWSDETLKCLFGAMFPSAALTKCHAVKLIELHELNRTLVESLERAAEVTWPPSTSNRHDRPIGLSTSRRHAPIVFTVGVA